MIEGDMKIIVNSNNAEELVGTMVNRIGTGQVAGWACDRGGDFICTVDTEVGYERAWISAFVMHGEVHFLLLPFDPKVVLSDRGKRVLRDYFLDMLHLYFGDKVVGERVERLRR